MRFAGALKLRIPVCMVFSILGLDGALVAQPRSNISATAGLIERLNQQWAQSDTLFSFTCGQLGTRDQEDRSVASELVKLGPLAVPEISTALATVEQRGKKSEWDTNSQWLLNADAAIEGSAAFPRLQRMIQNPGLDFLHPALGDAMASALGLTSYVDSLAPPERKICGDADPRDALDQFIFGWEIGNEKLVEDAAGPAALRELSVLLRNRKFDSLRSALVKSTSRYIAVGYRFRPASGWSESRGSILKNVGHPLVSSVDLGSPEIAITWADQVGGECGSGVVIFLRKSEGPRARYLVNNADVEELFNQISSCAARVSGAAFK